MTGIFIEFLGVHPEASEEEIKTAYRELARIHHPDAGAGKEKPPDQEFFKSITEAYATLTNPEKRREYDYTHGARHPNSSISWLKRKSDEILFPVRRSRTAAAWKKKQEAEKVDDDKVRLVLISVLGTLTGIFCALLIYGLFKLIF